MGRTERKRHFPANPSLFPGGCLPRFPPVYYPPVGCPLDEADPSKKRIRQAFRQPSVGKIQHRKGDAILIFRSFQQKFGRFEKGPNRESPSGLGKRKFAGRENHPRNTRPMVWRRKLVASLKPETPRGIAPPTRPKLSMSLQPRTARAQTFPLRLGSQLAVVEIGRGEWE